MRPQVLTPQGGGYRLYSVTSITRHIMAFGHNQVVLFHDIGYMNNITLVRFIIYYIKMSVATTLHYVTLNRHL